MGFIKETHINCDGCGDTYGVDDMNFGFTAYEIRYDAGKEGWLNRGAKDFCLKCTPDKKGDPRQERRPPMKPKKLPTFTIRDCQKAGASMPMVKFYGDGFGRLTKINIMDILNATERGDCPVNTNDVIDIISPRVSYMGVEQHIDIRPLLGTYDKPTELGKVYANNRGNEMGIMLNHYCHIAFLVILLLELGYDVTGELA